MVSPLFVSPGVWGASFQEQVCWRIQDAVRDGIVRIEVEQIKRKYQMTEEEIIDLIVEERSVWNILVEAWGKPGYEFTPFEAKLVERIYQGE